jgi:hypothetical protein
MATPRGTYDHDVFVSYARPDLVWAQRLKAELSRRDIRCFLDEDIAPSATWGDALNDALDASHILVVLWSIAAQGSEGVRAEIAGFEALARQDPERSIVPVLLGGTALLAEAPSAIVDAKLSARPRTR